MANYKKCDKCGEFYKAEDSECLVDFKDSGETMFINYDLCVKCARAFIRFMKETSI